MRTEPMHLAMDPGGLTGWVLFDPVDMDGPDQQPLTVIDWGEDSMFDFLDKVWRWNTHPGLTKVVCESYKPRAGIRTWEPEALYQIGAVAWMMRGAFHFQSPGDAKKFGTPAKMAPFRYGDNPVGKGGEGHALDALRHALLYSSML